MFRSPGIVRPAFCQPQPGDLIEIFRGTYQHWVLYIGEGDIIHLAPPSEITGPGPNRLMSVMYDKATVLREDLTEVAGKDKFHVNNLLDKKHEPRHVQAILRDAHSLLGLELPYCVLWGNCEHFVTELRYGRAESQQATMSDKNLEEEEGDEDTFFKHEETSMFMTWLLSSTLTTKKLFLILSLLNCIFLTAVLATDFMFHFELRNHRFPSRSHTEAILMYHVVNFHWALLAATYSFQTGNKRMGYLSSATVFFNLCIFASRCGFEFMMMQFREEEF
ncbi:hypothetical protein ACEWY4_009653 [Coilia grayii]|uniref:LRAT domain-containing protein n=1 Tax=Coilia grayii TaxID=363190 RepID=A0ABD1K719_9TELE